MSKPTMDGQVVYTRVGSVLITTLLCVTTSLAAGVLQPLLELNQPWHKRKMRFTAEVCIMGTVVCSTILTCLLRWRLWFPLGNRLECGTWHRPELQVFMFFCKTAWVTFTICQCMDIQLFFIVEMPDNNDKTKAEYRHAGLFSEDGNKQKKVLTGKLIDTKIFVVWLESFEDSFHFPASTLGIDLFIYLYLFRELFWPLMLLTFRYVKI